MSNVNNRFTDGLDSIIKYIDIIYQNNTSKNGRDNYTLSLKEMLIIYRHNFTNDIRIFNDICGKVYEVSEAYILEMNGMIEILKVNVEQRFCIPNEHIIDIIKSKRFFKFLNDISKHNLITSVKTELSEDLLSLRELRVISDSFDAVGEQFEKIGLNNLLCDTRNDYDAYNDEFLLAYEQQFKHHEHPYDNLIQSELRFSSSVINEHLYDVLTYDGTDIIKSKGFIGYIKSIFTNNTFNELVKDIDVIEGDGEKQNKYNIAMNCLDVLMNNPPDDVREILMNYIDCKEILVELLSDDE